MEEVAKVCKAREVAKEWARAKAREVDKEVRWVEEGKGKVREDEVTARAKDEEVRAREVEEVSTSRLNHTEAMETNRPGPMVVMATSRLNQVWVKAWAREEAAKDREEVAKAKAEAAKVARMEEVAKEIKWVEAVRVVKG